jgi:hypothetical protein
MRGAPAARLAGGERFFGGVGGCRPAMRKRLIVGRRGRFGAWHGARKGRGASRSRFAQKEPSLMTTMIRRVALPIALLVALAGSSMAASKATKPDGRGSRAAIQKNRAKRGLSTRIKVRAVRDSRSGKSSQVLSQVVGSGKVEAYNVNKATGTARRTPTGLVSQGKAMQKANQKLRRTKGSKKGTFAGVQAEGLSKNGNYQFGSQSDRSDKVFVSPVTGRAVKFEKELGKGGRDY